MNLLRTPFFEHHKAAGGRLIDFGGWELPVQYTGIIEEHKQVRSSVGLFDVSHMGEVFLRGPGALDAIRYLVTNSIDIPNGHAQYTAMCNPAGGIVDDCEKHDDGCAGGQHPINLRRPRGARKGSGHLAPT